MRNMVCKDSHLSAEGFIALLTSLYVLSGPIIRISPHELHVNDPSFISELYVGGGKQRDKYWFSAEQFGFVFRSSLAC